MAYHNVSHHELWEFDELMHCVSASIKYYDHAKAMSVAFINYLAPRQSSLFLTYDGPLLGINGRNTLNLESARDSMTALGGWFSENVPNVGLVHREGEWNLTYRNGPSVNLGQWLLARWVERYMPGVIENEDSRNRDRLIKAALNELDPSNDAHWTKEGRPRVAAVRKYLFTSRAVIDRAMPGFCREVAS